MINNKNEIVVNLENAIYSDNVYEISLNNYDNTFFIVYANNTPESLDIVIDYCESKDLTGYFTTETEVVAMNYTQSEIDSCFVVAGNHCLYVNVEHLQINKLNKEATSC